MALTVAKIGKDHEAFRPLELGDGVPGGAGDVRRRTRSAGTESANAESIGDPSVSRRHARILVTGETAELEDLGSKNCSAHAGRRLDGPVPLRDGEGFRIGSVDLVFRAASVSASTATAP
jgi:pSer/pThr/pTyr-binding forkhead associated (FHA) protein